MQGLAGRKDGQESIRAGSRACESLATTARIAIVGNEDIISKELRRHMGYHGR